MDLHTTPIQAEISGRVAAGMPGDCATKIRKVWATDTCPGPPPALPPEWLTVDCPKRHSYRTGRSTVPVANR